jgi:4-amino-4-deoxychorismate lyase
MSLLLETIRLYHGKFNNLNFHQDRMQRTLKEVFDEDAKIDLAGILEMYPAPLQGLHKCRLTYNNNINEVEFIPYMAKSVNTLKCVDDNRIRYTYKFKDRTDLERNFERRINCDDILIIKDGLVTDSSFANVIFKDQKRWVTPASFLLPGTQRQYLLDNGLITEEKITKADISKYSAFKLINSMLLFDGPEIPVENIVR